MAVTEISSLISRLKVAELVGFSPGG